MWKPTDTREENHRRLKGKDSDMFTSMSKEAIEQYLEAAREAGFILYTSRFAVMGLTAYLLDAYPIKLHLRKLLPSH